MGKQYNRPETGSSKQKVLIYPIICVTVDPTK